MVLTLRHSESFLTAVTAAAQFPPSKAGDRLERFHPVDSRPLGEADFMDIKRVGVIGAGTMGSGIAHVFARSGYTVVL